MSIPTNRLTTHVCIKSIDLLPRFLCTVLCPALNYGDDDGDGDGDGLFDFRDKLAVVVSVGFRYLNLSSPIRVLLL